MATPEIGATLPEIGAIAAAANPRSAATMTATTTPIATAGHSTVGGGLLCAMRQA